MVSILTGLMEAIYTELFIYIYRVFTLVKLYISLKTQLIKGGFYEAKGAKKKKKKSHKFTHNCYGWENFIIDDVVGRLLVVSFFQHYLKHHIRTISPLESLYKSLHTQHLTFFSGNASYNVVRSA